MMKKIQNVIFLLLLTGLFSCKYGEGSQALHVAKTEQLQLQGVILNIPNKGDLELALFALDNQNRPKQLLAVERYKGNGNAVTFQVDFDTAKAQPFKALELRGRVTQGGQLVGYLAPWYKQQLSKQDLKGIILELPQ